MSSSESTSNTSIDSCSCTEEFSPDKNSSIHCCNNSQDFKNKKSSSLTLLAQNLRRGRSLNFTNKRVRKCGRQTKEPSASTSNTSTKNKSNKWVMKFNCTKKERNCPEDTQNMKCCVCTCYRRTDEHHLGAGVVFQQDDSTENGEVQLNESVAKTEVNDSEIKLESEDSVDTNTNAQPVVPENATATANNSSDVYGNLGSANCCVILGPPLDAAW